MKLLFFTPYAYIDVHTYPEAVVADNFRRRGHEVLYVGCRGLYSTFCISMSCINLRPGSDPHLKADVCVQCQQKRDKLYQDFELPSLFIDDFIEPADLQDVEEKLTSVTPENWMSVQLSDLPIPLYSCYEYFLNEKISSTAISDEHWPGFITHVRNALLTAVAGQRLLKRVSPDAVLAYNLLYSCNHVMAALAERQGAKSYTLHAGAHHRRRRSKMTIFSALRPAAMVARSLGWERCKSRPLTSEAVDVVTEHVKELLEATSPWVYSTKAQNLSRQELRSRFQIADDQKVLLVTMSSGDEYFAAQLIGAVPERRPGLFKNQLQWVGELLKWITDRPDLFLIIRVHPREFPNKRETVLSQQALLLREVLNDLPANAKVNWPTDELSLHDVAKIIDLCLNATSTAGLELSLLGIPVLLYDKNHILAYPPSLNLTADQTTEYFAAIDQGVAEGPRIENIINAYRWIAFLTDVVAIDMSEAYDEHREVQSVPAREPKKRRWWSRLLEGRDFESAPQVVEKGPMFWSGLDRLRNAQWLAYAVEHGVDSHVDAFIDRLVRDPAPSATHERQCVIASARPYLETLDLWSGLEKALDVNATLAAGGIRAQATKE